MKTCDRCGVEVGSWTTSFFNTQDICLPCVEKEQKHPKFHEAKEAERKAVLLGNLNFPGIGLPKDLR